MYALICTHYIHTSRGVMRLVGTRGKEASLAPPCLKLRSFGNKPTATVLKNVFLFVTML